MSTSANSSFQKGDEVVRRDDVGRRGILTGRERNRAGTIYYQVMFKGSTDYVPEYELKIRPTEDPYCLIEQGDFGKISDLRQNLTHIQLSGKLSNLIYSMDVTNTEFYPHQFKPVLAFLESPSRGLLIADEVGLGKTIEAGLIWTELRARQNARRVLVVCPAMLREKWRDELRDRFGVDAMIMGAAELHTELQRDPNMVSDGKGIICSLQGIRPLRNWRDREEKGQRCELARFLDEQSNNPLLDLVIIDEAHYLRNPRTQTAQLGQMLREVSTDILLLSATPINLRNEDLFNLLKVVDPDTFDNSKLFPQVLEANAPLIKARECLLDDKEDVQQTYQHLVEASKHILLSSNKQLLNLIDTLRDSANITPAERVKLADRIERVNLLSHVVTRTRKVEVTEWKSVREPLAQRVPLDEDGPEWHFYTSVTDKIREYAMNEGISDGFLLANPQRQVSSCMYAAAKSWLNKTPQINMIADEVVYEAFGDDDPSSRGQSSLIAYLVAEVLPTVDLQRLREHDSKYEQFRCLVTRYLEKFPQKQIIVFSFFRGTLFYLEERLREEKVESQVLVGGMPENKQEVIHRFRTSSTCKVLLSSEVASEGVDLQFCQMMVNYDLPWNPMKIEQRIGRLDRIGQQADMITIYNLRHADTIDDRIYERLFERIEIFTRALGGMEAILGEEIRNLTDDLFRDKLTPKQEEERISRTALAIEKNRLSQETLEKQASNLIAHGGYITQRVQAAHDSNSRIIEGDLIVYVSDYLDRYATGNEFHQPDGAKPQFDIKLPAPTAAKLEVFVQNKKLPQTRLSRGERVQCEFVNKITGITRSIERISQFHSLIRFISDEIENRSEGYFPVVAAKLLLSSMIGTKSPLSSGQYAFVVRKWVFTGLRDEEELRAKAIHLETSSEVSFDDSSKLLNAMRLNGQDWPEARNEVDSESLLGDIDNCEYYLRKEFEEIRESRTNENSDRVNFQIQSAKRHRDRRITVLEGVIEDFRASGKTRMIPATRGKIEREKEAFSIQDEKLRSKAQFTSDTLPICYGVVFLE